MVHQASDAWDANCYAQVPNRQLKDWSLPTYRFSKIDKRRRFEDWRRGAAGGAERSFPMRRYLSLRDVATADDGERRRKFHAARFYHPTRRLSDGLWFEWQARTYPWSIPACSSCVLIFQFGKKWDTSRYAYPSVSMRIPVLMQYSALIRHLWAVSLHHRW
jgi:hypothetical protein